MRADIIAAIERERAYQIHKWGNQARSVPAWLLILEQELQEAKLAWAKTENDRDALCEILQVATSAVACLQDNGVVERAYP